MSTETIGERLYRLRTSQGLSQRDLSDAGTSYAFISRIESGDRQPSEKALRKIAAKLGVTPHYLESGGEGACPHCGFNSQLVEHSN